VTLSLFAITIGQPYHGDAARLQLLFAIEDPICIGPAEPGPDV
jgi:hypothetical protein